MNNEILLEKFFNRNENGIVSMEYAIDRLGTIHGVSKLFTENNFNIPTIHGIYRIEYKTYFADSRRFIEITEV